MPIIGGKTALAEIGQVNLAYYDNLKTSLGGGHFDWSAAMAQALTDAAAGNIKRVVIPDLGSPYYFTSGWPSLPNGFHVDGYGKPTLDFSGAGNVSAITLTTNCRAERLHIIGNGQNSTASIGLDFNGNYINAVDIDVEQFGTGWYGVHNNTYITECDKCHFYNCGLVVDARIGSVTNSGEMLKFRGGVMANSNVIFQGNGSTNHVVFEGVSLDYSTDFGQFDNGYYFFTDCHLETNSVTTTQGYLFRKINGANVRFENTRIDMSGIHLIIDRATEGTSGFIEYSGCTAFFTPTAGGSAIVRGSEYQIFVASGGTTTTFDSPFISRTVVSSVAMGLHSGNGALAILPPAISFASSSTLATATYASAVPSNAVAILRFS